MKRITLNSGTILYIALVIIALLALLAFRPQELIRDSTQWARYVDTAHPMIWHPHHLLYMPINLWILRGPLSFCGSCNAVLADQIHSAVWTIIMVLSMHYIVLRLTGKPFLSFVLALLLLFSQSIWVLALQPQAYVPLIGTISLMLAYLLNTKNKPYSLRWALTLAALFGLAVLYHQAMVLLSLPVAYYVATTKRPHGIKAATVVLLISGAGVLSLYLWATFNVMGVLTIRSFIDYVTMFAQVMADPNYWSIGNFTIPTVVTLTSSQLNSIYFPPWQLRDLQLALFGLALALLFIWNTRQVIVKASWREERVFFLLIITEFWLFTLWGNPADDGWPTFILLPIFILVGISLSDLMPSLERLKPARNLLYAGLVLFVVGIALRNFNERILPMHLSKGKHYDSAKNIADVIPKECTVYELDQLIYYDLTYYFYRTHRDFWDIITAAYYGTPRQRSTYFGSPDQSACIAINTRYLDPSINVSGKTAFKFPDEWLKLIVWIFNIREVTPDRYEWRKMRITTSENKRTYLIVFNKQMTEPMPIGTFWDTLIHESQQSNTGNPGAYAKWLNESCPRLNKDQSLLKLCNRL